MYKNMQRSEDTLWGKHIHSKRIETLPVQQPVWLSTAFTKPLELPFSITISVPALWVMICYIFTPLVFVFSASDFLFLAVAFSSSVVSLLYIVNSDYLASNSERAFWRTSNGTLFNQYLEWIGFFYIRKDITTLERHTPGISGQTHSTPILLPTSL